MSFAEIEDAVMALPEAEQRALFEMLSGKLREVGSSKGRRGLKAAARPAIKGLPADLSVRVKERMRELMAERHASNR
jgi:hypothetical protein